MADTEKTGAEARQPGKRPSARAGRQPGQAKAQTQTQTNADAAKQPRSGRPQGRRRSGAKKQPAENAAQTAVQTPAQSAPQQPRPRQRQRRQDGDAAEQGGRQQKLKIIPLGGLGEIGKNMTAYEYGDDIVVVDCGMGFPDEDMYGIDVVIPDISYLKANAGKIRGIVITHGHEDHIGAIPYVIGELDVPIYATALTNAIIELKLEERGLLKNTQIFTKKAGDRFRLAPSR